MPKSVKIPDTTGPIPKGILKRAVLILTNKKSLGGLLEKAKDLKGAARDLREKFADIIRLLNAWRKGEYRNVSYSTLILGAAALIYFITPLDLVPDFIPFTGFIDDAAILSYVITRIQKDILEFKEWEANRL